MSLIIRENSLYIAVLRNTWTSAQEASEALGGDLATINSKEEDVFLQNTFGATAPKSGGYNWGYWIGLYRDPADQGDTWEEWKWVSGEPVT